jgi:hypothetical protein
MIEQARHDQLNTAIDAAISGGEFARTGDAEVDTLSRLASGLRGLASADFKARLRAELLPGEEQRDLIPWVRKLPASSSFTRERGLVAAGGGCGLVAGGCCVGGTVVNLLGLASAASVAAFIETSLPYFIGVSILMMTGMLYWMYRSAGFKRANLAPAFVRVGVVVGAGYGVVFAATMALSMAMGLY